MNQSQWQLWQNFCQTGKIEDYLLYKREVKNSNGEDQHKGHGHPGSPV